jgi:adenylylsulfate kinase-like enzyme
MSADARIPVLLVSGTVGVGKSTILDAIHELLSRAEVPHGCVDADALALSWPRRGDFNQVAVLENVASLWRNARRVGAQRFVIATVVERREELDAYRHAIPHAELVLVQLTAPEAVRVARLRRREIGAELEWHLQRTAGLQRILDDAALHDFAIANDGRPAREVALEVLTRAGWPVAQ